MSRHAIQEPELERAHPQRAEHGHVQLLQRAGGALREQPVQLRLPPQDPVDDLRGQPCVAAVQAFERSEQRQIGPGAALDALQRAESGSAGGTHTQYNRNLELEKAILRRVGQAVTRFGMIREGDRIAVGFSGGKDSFTLLSALLLLQKRAPVRFSVQAFTIDQGKFLAPVAPFRAWMQEHGVQWTCRADNPSLRLLAEQPGHGCDLCSRFRRRAVYALARELGANVIALGHTADDLCESFLRNAMFTGRLAALPPVAWSRKREFRLIRPLIYVTEDLTRAWAGASGAPVIPCGCSLRTGTVRRSLRGMLDELERQHPHLKATLLKALGNVEASRLLDPRYFEPEEEQAAPEGAPLPVLHDPAFTEL